ncbi:MAG: histidine kinase [Micrococcaceae bacterium]
MAREMHDIIAHSLSVIIAQADGARYTIKNNPEKAFEALENIANTGRSSLIETRRLMGVLQSDTKTTMQPAPGLADIEDLVNTVKLSSLDVSFKVEGKQQGTLPSGAELTIYGIFQESFTNILKHAGSQVQVMANLIWSTGGVSIVIKDDGRGHGTESSHIKGNKQGIVGMKERVKLYDG